MSEGGSGAPASEARVSTGCPALDTMLHGGLVSRRPYLIVGPSGTGKTTLALQFLLEGVRHGERVLIVTLEEPPNEMRTNHRFLGEELDRVYVFDAIPDVMRYERAPFKDISAVRSSVPFGKVPLSIRKTAELSSVEVTFTALEQMLKMEMARQGYQRLVIDSLTALQYFCMKGFDETLGAQTFLRFLSDLRVTTILTVEAPLEDVETPERLLARGEVRLFRWEHEGRTVRAIGVEKFRGSEHDVRLHPYRISPKGLDINLAQTISRDTQQLIGAAEPEELAMPAVATGVETYETGLDALEQDTRDLVAVGAETAGFRATILEALASSAHDSPEEVLRIVARARGRVFDSVLHLPLVADDDAAARAGVRLRTRAAAARAGIPPSVAPPISVIRESLERILAIVDRRGEAPVLPPTASSPAEGPMATTVTPPARGTPSPAAVSAAPVPAPKPAVTLPPPPPPPPPAPPPPPPPPQPSPMLPAGPAAAAAPSPAAEPARAVEPARVTLPARPATPTGTSGSRPAPPTPSPQPTHERAGPPPLPNVAVPIPPPGALTGQRPESPAPAPAALEVPAAVPPAPAPAAAGPTLAPRDATSGEPGVVAGVEKAKPKRQRKTPVAGVAAPRRRSPKAPQAPAPETPTPPAGTEPTSPLPGESVPEPPKPRRRATRKKAPATTEPTGAPQAAAEPPASDGPPAGTPGAPPPSGPSTSQEG